MNRGLKKLIVTLGLVVLLGVRPSFAANQHFDGNDNGHVDSVGHETAGFTSIKLDNPTPGEHKLGNGITVIISDDKKSATVVSEAYTKEGYTGQGKEEINFVHMKGGDAFICYYNGEFTNMVCPENNGGNIPEISHITIFYAEKGNLTPEPPVTPPEDPVTTGDTSLVLPLIGVGAGAIALVLANKKDED